MTLRVATSKSRRLRAMQFALWAHTRGERLPSNPRIAAIFECGVHTAADLKRDFIEARRPYLERPNGPG